MRQRRQRRQQREQLRPGCCQTVLLLIPALLVKATGCIVETCRGCCGGSTQRGALGHHRRRRDKPAPKYKSVRPEWDSDSSSVDALSSASERGPHTRQQKSPCAEQRQPRAQPQARRQRRPPHSDDGESTLSDSSSDNDFVLPRARSPAAVRDRPRRSTTTSEKKKPAARFAQSSSDSDSDMEDGAVFPEQRRQRQQPQSDNGESSDSSSDNNFVSPHSTDPATPRASSRHSGTQRDRQMHARTAETAAAAARRPTVASIVDQPAQQSDTLKKPSTTLKLLPSRSVQSASPTVAMQRVRQHSDLRASANSDAGPHVEEWLALPDARARTGKGVQGQRGQGGEELIRQLAATLREREPSEENSFIDPDFPPQNTSLYKDSEAVGGMREGAPLDSVFLASLPPDEADSGDAAKKPVVWCRAAEIGLKAELQYKRAGSSGRAEDVVGPDAIRQLVEGGTLNDDTLVFFPYKNEQGRRHTGWHGTHRRWAECKHEFAGGELSQDHRPSVQLKVWHQGDVQPSDIKQGLLGDCYLMAACASIALLPPEYLVHDLIIDCSDVGLFGVKFYFAGRWMSVAIDDRFPCIISGGVVRPCFAQPSSDGALWTCIIEKAFAKLMGSFEALIGGEAVDAQNYLCAGDVETRELDGSISLNDDCSSTAGSPTKSTSSTKRLMEKEMKEDAAERIWMELCTRIPLPRDRSASSIAFDRREGTVAAAFFSCAVASGRTSAATSSGLNTQHQYSILGAIELASGERIVELRDPHGKCQWKGAYSATDSARWTSTVKREILGSSRLSVPESGCAFMTWSDFKSFFKEIGICSAFPQAKGEGMERRLSVLGNWQAGVSAGGKCGHETFKFNPAFSLRLRDGRTGRSKRRTGGDERVRVKVTLSQPDTRPMLQQSRDARTGACDHATWEDMYLYCLTASTYRRLTSPRTVSAGATQSGKQSIRDGASRFGGKLFSRQQPQPVEYSDPYLPDWVREISPTLRLHRRLGQAELELDPHENYVLVACAWAPGVSDSTDAEHSKKNDKATSIAGVGNGWDFCITMHASVDVQLSPLDADRSSELPTPEQRRLMQSLRTRQARCCMCERMFKPGDPHYDIPEGQTHLGKCYEDYREKIARRCLECGDAVLGAYHQLDEDDPSAAALRSKVNAPRGVEATDDWKHPLVLHSEQGCYARYRERHAPRCTVCGGPVLSKFFEVDDGGAKLIIHGEGNCYQQYQEARAERCLVCKRPLLDRYYDVEAGKGKVHAEGDCLDQWKARQEGQQSRRQYHSPDSGVESDDY